MPSLCIALQHHVVVREGLEEAGKRSLVLREALGPRPERRCFQQHLGIEQLHRGGEVLPALGRSKILREREHAIPVHRPVSPTNPN
jgi:hypothetical protein